MDVLNSGNSIRKSQSRTGRKARLGAVAVGLTVGFASVAVPSAAADPAGGELAWGPCPAEYALDPDTDQCGTVTVPRDYANPGAGSIDVLVTRHGAEDPAARRGVLFTNPGGPGGDAIASNGMFAQALPEQIRRQWDFIGVQPRGLAHAGAVECAVTPELLAAMNVGFAGGAARLACDGAAPGATAHITTENTARDWEQVRIALGVDVIDVYGLSYGTILASTYATLFPRHTGRMVLDSAVDREWLWNDVLWHQNDGYKARFYDLMDWIAANDAIYGLGGTPLQVYQRWSDRIVGEAGATPPSRPHRRRSATSHPAWRMSPMRTGPVSTSPGPPGSSSRRSCVVSPIPLTLSPRRVSMPSHAKCFPLGTAGRWSPASSGTASGHFPRVCPATSPRTNSTRLSRPR